MGVREREGWIQAQELIGWGHQNKRSDLKGFDKVIWSIDDQESKPGKPLVLKYLSKDGEEGYPGNLSVKLAYGEALFCFKNDSPN